MTVRRARQVSAFFIRYFTLFTGEEAQAAISSDQVSGRNELLPFFVYDVAQKRFNPLNSRWLEIL
jgi:hypothetical protein